MSDSNTLGRILSTSSRLADWMAKYEAEKAVLPQPGTVLRGEGDVALNCIALVGKEPFLYGWAYVRDKVGYEPCWLMRSDENFAEGGVHCIIMPRSRDAFFGNQEPRNGRYYTRSIRVVKIGAAGNLLCEVGT